LTYKAIQYNGCITVVFRCLFWVVIARAATCKWSGPCIHNEDSF